MDELRSLSHALASLLVCVSVCAVSTVARHGTMTIHRKEMRRESSSVNSKRGEIWAHVNVGAMGKEGGSRGRDVGAGECLRSDVTVSAESSESVVCSVH